MTADAPATDPAPGASQPGPQSSPMMAPMTSPMMAPGVRILGSGVALPPQVRTNDDLAKIVETSDEWITQRTGIRERRIAAEDVGVADLAAEAVAAGLRDAGLDTGEIDLLIVATMTPEMPTPSTAARVADRLGATPAGALDVSAACSGFVYGINLAATQIACGAARRVAVVGAEVLSRITNWSDRGTCILFGDAAGAVILGADEDKSRGCLHQAMHSDGGMWRHLYCPREARDLPEGGVFNDQFDTIQMNGREVFKFAVSKMQESIDQAIAACGVSADDLAMILPHQSNLRILESSRQRLGLDASKMCINIDRYGNTSAASVPLCLDEVRRDGRIREGDLVLFVAVGGGMTWATSMWRI